MCGGAGTSFGAFQAGMPVMIEDACCGSCAIGQPCEGEAHEHAEGGCASGVCGVAATDRAMKDQRSAGGLGRSAGGLFTDRYHDSGVEALRALIAWRAITPATWFATTQANREAWARSWVATLNLPTARERNEIVAAVLVPSAAQLGVATRSGSTDTSGGRIGATPGADAVPANWATMTDAERTAWANRYADAHGMTATERAEFAQRAREADAALVRGLVSEGLSTIRELIRTGSAERIAQIEADAAARGARLAADRATEERILNELRNGGGGGNATPTTRKKSGAGGVALLALVAVAAKALV